MSQNLTELVAELRERVRKLEARQEAMLDAAGNVRSTSVSATPIHGHSGGGQGGPLNNARHSTYDDFAEQTDAPGTPPANTVRLYAKTDGRLYSKDDAGTESGPL